LARWQPLPRELDPAAVQFVALLRHLKDGSGRTMRRLSAETGYSVSSWERYLGGRALPPVDALTAFAKAVGEDPVRLVTLREAAAAAWSRESGGEAEAGTGSSMDSNAGTESDQNAQTFSTSPSAGEIPAPGRDGGSDGGLRGLLGSGRLGHLVPNRGTATTILLSAAAGAIVAILVMPGTDASASSTTPRVTIPPKPHYTCNYTQVNGQWFAGNSTTLSQALVVDTYGPDVAELQCMLQHAGITPGGIDGNFGPLTELAVIKAQKKFDLDVDGQVGPKTSAALRG
jgi:hypothetical protein